MTEQPRDASAPLDGPRAARPDEREQLLSLLNEIHRAGKGLPPSIATDWPHIYDPDNLDNVLVVSDGEAIIASVGLWVNDVALGSVRLRVGGINCLATRPEYRRRGLGAGVMQAAHARMAELGCHVGLLGTAITEWYRRLGWELAGRARSYRLDRGNIGLLPPLPEGTELRVAGEDALPEVIRLHHGDRLGGLRWKETFARIYRARGAPDVVLAWRKGTAHAYLLARRGSVIEWGGQAEAVASLLRAWFERCDDPSASTSLRDASFRAVHRPELTLTAPGGGHGLLALLDRLGIPYSTSYTGMLYVADPRGILDAFGLEEVAVAAEGERFTLTRGKDSVTLDRRALAKLLFGPERVSSFAAEVLPLPFWQWPLEHV